MRSITHIDPGRDGWSLVYDTVPKRILFFCGLRLLFGRDWRLVEMPTISESPLPDLEEKRRLAVDDYIYARDRTIDDSPDVLRARLFALKLRGEDLNSQMRLAQSLKTAYHEQCKKEQRRPGAAK